MSASSEDENPARGELSPEDREAFRRRASDLGARLDKVKAQARAKGQAMKIAIEPVVGIAVGGFIGKVLDDQFGTAPWMLIVFLMLGFAAGLLNIVRAARRLQAEAEPLQRSAKAVPDDEDDDGR